MLGFQEAILSEALAEDGLTVLGRGLGLHGILAQLVRIYSAAGTAPAVAAADGGPQQALVFVLNVGKDQQQQLEEDLSTVTGTHSPAERASSTKRCTKMNCSALYKFWLYSPR